MNTLQVRKHIKKLYQSAMLTIKKEFVSILNPLYQEIYDEAVALGFDGDLRDLDEGWIEEFFDEYNPTTKYVFSNEIDRKESRLFESLVASTNERHQSYKTAERLLNNQIKQYGIELEDAISRLVYEDMDVEYVKWKAEHDHKTCSECKELDGQVFELKDAPPKVHYQCRCILVPYKDKK